MKYFPLGSGALMPGLGLGTWNADPGVVGEAVKSAIDLGYRHLDCAAIYGNEPEIGAVLKELLEGEGDLKREDLFLTSKLWNEEHAPNDVEAALRKTLEELGVEYLDLYLMHWPVALEKRPGGTDWSKPLPFLSLDDLPLIDTWRAMEKCVDKGLVKDIGVSNFSKKKLQELIKGARIKPSVNQVELHPYLQQQELIDYCKEEGIHVTAYSPLGSNGRDPAFKDPNEVPILEDATIAQIASQYPSETSPAQVLLAWALARGTSVIPKSVSLKRQAENLESVNLVDKLNEENIKAIAALDRNARYLDGSFWCSEGSPYTLENLWDEDVPGSVCSSVV